MEGYGGGKVQGIRNINGRYKIDRERLRINLGNGEAKELKCMTHGHELSGLGGGAWNSVGRGDAGWRRIKGRKKLDNYNSIINRIYFKKIKA